MGTIATTEVSVKRKVDMLCSSLSPHRRYNVLCLLPLRVESEVMSKVAVDKRHLRDNEGLAGVIYHDVHHPLCYCEEYQQKVYTCE